MSPLVSPDLQMLCLLPSVVRVQQDHLRSGLLLWHAHKVGSGDWGAILQWSVYVCVQGEK
jgi:hypothetical protein